MPSRVLLCACHAQESAEAACVRTYASPPSLPQDLFSALIKGPTRTPYEDGLYLFDIQLPNIYPAVPPHFCYLSQCSGRLNPNLYDNGKVCVSLLGTWIGKVSPCQHPSGCGAGGGRLSGGVGDRGDRAVRFRGQNGGPANPVCSRCSSPSKVQWAGRGAGGRPGGPLAARPPVV